MTVLSYFLIVLASLIVSYGLKLYFTRIQKFDAINHRSVHHTKATKTGGMTVFLTLYLFSIYYYLNALQIFDFSLLIPLGIMFMVGVYDDLYNADFKLKFFIQIIVAKILIDQGFVIDNFHGVLGLNEIPRLASQIFTVFVFLVIVNAINFIDGIDGLAITEAIKVILVVEFFSLQSTPLFSLGTVTALSILPLFYFNFKKDYKVFLGDAGSLFLGTLIAIYLFYVLGSDYTLKPPFSANKPLLAMSLIAYPLIDLLRVFVIRIRIKKSPFSPDQNHLHHFFIKKGFAHLNILLIVLCFSLIFLLVPFWV